MRKESPHGVGVRKESPHGVGVRKDRRRALKKPFKAYAKLGGREFHLGYFATAAKAREARRRFIEREREWKSKP